MNVYAFRKSNKARGIGRVTLTTRVIGFEEFFIGYVRMGSVLVIHVGVSVARMGCPSTPYLSLSVHLSCPIDSGSPLVSPGWRSHCWALPSLAWEGGGPPTRSCALFPMAGMW
jgi:hypothetical protein